MGDEYDMATIEDGFEKEERSFGCGKLDGDCVHYFSDCKGCPLAPTDSKNCLKERKTESFEKVTVVRVTSYIVIKGHNIEEE